MNPNLVHNCYSIKNYQILSHTLLIHIPVRIHLDHFVHLKCSCNVPLVLDVGCRFKSRYSFCCDCFLPNF